MSTVQTEGKAVALPGGFHLLRFFVLTAVSFLPLVVVGLGSGRIHDLLSAIISLVMAFRVSSLSGPKAATESSITISLVTCLFSWLALATLGWISAWGQGYGLWYDLVVFVEFAVAILILIGVNKSVLGGYSTAKTPPTKTQAVFTTTLDSLAIDRKMLESIRASLARTLTDVIDQRDLDEAWKNKNAALIEQILNRESANLDVKWTTGVNIFNSAIGIIENARELLNRRLESAQNLLIKLGMEPVAQDNHSKVSLEVQIPHLRVQRDFTQRLNYSQGLTRMGAQAITTRAPWQLAVPAMVVVAIVGLAANSRLLRQAAEVQGRLFERAALAEADFHQFISLIDTRLLPQQDAIIRTIASLENLTKKISDNLESGLNKSDAIALAFSIVEAKKILQAPAGD